MFRLVIVAALLAAGYLFVTGGGLRILPRAGGGAVRTAGPILGGSAGHDVGAAALGAAGRIGN